MKPDLLQDLNEVQREAVLYEKGPLLILAGAGSGKTRVITYRIAHLILDNGVPPWNIAAVTFTNKAADEMKERLRLLVGESVADSIMVRTFHSLALYILSRHPEGAGYRSGFSVYDDSAQKTVIRSILKELKIPAEYLKPESAAQYIDRFRDAHISPDEASEQRGHYIKEIVPVYREYLKRLKDNNAIDFGGLLYEAVNLLRNHPEIRSLYANLWKHFMIDEYQDTNRCQYLLGRLIAGEHRNIVVVGDDDQSIYSWRGADIDNILNFEKDYPESLVLRLEQNYRSTSPILKAASTLIEKNTKRKSKTLFTLKEGGGAVRFIPFDSDSEEIAFIANRIQTLRSQGTRYSDIAVFYRTNAQSRAFEHRFMDAEIPFVIVGGFRFYERKEIKDIIAYLSVVVNPADEVSLERIINIPARGVGETGIARLHELAGERGITLFEALSRAEEIKAMRGSRKVRELHEILSELRAKSDAGENPTSIVRRLYDRSGYMEMLLKDRDPESQSRVENLNELLNSLKEFEERKASRDEPPHLVEFLQTVSLMTSVAEKEERTDRVSLMTLHNAKGLEYPVVFISGLEEGFIPHSLSVEEGNVEEERRLLYVGITRARETLHLTASRFRNLFGTTQPRLLSRFLEEIEPSAIEREDGGSRTRRPRASEGAGSGPPRRKHEEAFSVGDEVRHASYGDGLIERLEQTPSGQKIWIHFPAENRVRIFLTEYTPIEKIREGSGKP